MSSSSDSEDENAKQTIKQTKKIVGYSCIDYKGLLNRIYDKYLL